MIWNANLTSLSPLHGCVNSGGRSAWCQSAVLELVIHLHGPASCCQLGLVALVLLVSSPHLLSLLLTPTRPATTCCSRPAPTCLPGPASHRPGLHHPLCPTRKDIWVLPPGPMPIHQGLPRPCYKKRERPHGPVSMAKEHAIGLRVTDTQSAICRPHLSTGKTQGVQTADLVP